MLQCSRVNCGIVGIPAIMGITSTTGIIDIRGITGIMRITGIMDIYIIGIICIKGCSFFPNPSVMINGVILFANVSLPLSSNTVILEKPVVHAKHQVDLISNFKK